MSFRYNAKTFLSLVNSMKPDVVLVGAGPVGLFTAIEMKLHNPLLQIKILDRNKEYTRHHILRLEKESLEKSMAYKTFEAVRSLNGFVPTSDIETTFLKIAKDLGIEIETGIKIDDCQTLFNKYPTAHTIIGADGAHSIVRRQLFDDKKIVDANLQYIVEIKYKAIGKTSLLPLITYVPALGQVKHFISENVGKEKNGSTPVSLFVFVDEETYKEIRTKPNAKLSDLEPTTERMTNLLNTIRPWLALRKVALNEAMLKNSEKINGVALSVYQSECFAKEINGKHVYVVGDAAAAVPYFRALNAGLIAAAVTAKEIATARAPDLIALNKKLSELAQNEISRAHSQNSKVNFGIGVNFVLAHATKISTGALLNSAYEEAMLNARVIRPNIFRRNPRTLVAIGLFLLTMATLFIVALNLYSIPLWPAAGLSLAGATTIVGTGVLLFKSIQFLWNRIKERANPTVPSSIFPWESEDNEEDSLTKLSKLKKNATNDATSSAVNQEIIHHPSLLRGSTLADDNEPPLSCDNTP